MIGPASPARARSRSSGAHASPAPRRQALAIGVRWSVGDAEPGTVRALERSVREVREALGRAARLAFCVHTVPAAEVRARVRGATGATWLQVDHDVPVFVRRRVDPTASSLAWRFAPLRVFAGLPEVALSPGFPLGPVAVALRAWAGAAGQRRCLLVTRRDAAGLTIALRGVPATFDVEDALAGAVAAAAHLESPSDVDRLEVAMLSAGAPPLVIAAGEARRDEGACAGAALSP